jgi:hypothetical protein
VGLFEQMRREYEHGVGAIKGVVRKFGVHRRMVREAIGNAVPATRKIPERDTSLLMGSRDRYRVAAFRADERHHFRKSGE